PIRRYPDLLVHRQLCRSIDARPYLSRPRRSAADAAVDEAEHARLEAASEASSAAERNAIAAERAMLDLKRAEFMLGHLLEPEAATIVSLASFGLFVELDAYPVEGLIRVESLDQGGYSFDEGSQAMVAPRKGARFRLGDRVLVCATNVSLARRQIDFAL